MQVRRSGLLVLGVVLLSFFVSSCRNKDDGYLDAKEMEDVLYDYHVGQELAGQSPDSIAYRQHLYADIVFRQHGLTEEEFNRNLLYYMRRAEDLKKIYQRIGERLAKEAGSGSNASVPSAVMAATTSTIGDTVNVWQGAPLLLLNTQTAHNRYSFHIEADSSYHAGDRFALYFTTGWIYREGAREMQACVCLRYANDSTEVRTMSVYTLGQQVLEIGGANEPVSSISGFFYQQGEPADQPRLLMISGVALLKMHVKAQPAPTSPAETPSSPATSPSKAPASPDSTHQLPSPAADSAAMKRRPHFRQEQEERATKAPQRYRRGNRVGA